MRWNKVEGNKERNGNLGGGCRGDGYMGAAIESLLRKK